MVKTTITLEDSLYRRLAKEALDRYGRTRSLSRLINEKLRSAEMLPKGSAGDIERSFGCWATKDTGARYVRKMRLQSEERLRRMNV
jgi:hypothetical protein